MIVPRTPRCEKAWPHRTGPILTELAEAVVGRTLAFGGQVA